MTETPRYGHAPIEMKLVANSSEMVAVGEFCWEVGSTGKRTLIVNIPHSRECGFSYSRWTIDHPNHCNAQWSWNGNETKPTLNPSLHAVGCWHGWVRDGYLVEA